MKAVLLGTDLMYDKQGRLLPIEINTNVGYDRINRVEMDEEWMNLTNLANFIVEKGITKIILDKTNGLSWRCPYFKEKLLSLLPEGTEFIYQKDLLYRETKDTELCIRIQFNEEALLDSYCRDKVEFLNLTYTSSKIAQEFIYKEDNKVKGAISFVDNGPNIPNYIVKFRYPKYSKGYPKFYKLKSVQEAYSLLESLSDGYLIMPCYFNKENLVDNRFRLFRQWSLFVVNEGHLQAIDLGTYTKLSGIVDFSKQKFDKNTGELIEGSEMYTTKSWYSFNQDIYLENGDQLLMSEGTWKNIEEVEVGNKVLSVDVPHAEDVDLKKHTSDYNVDEEEFETDSTFTINTIQHLEALTGYQDIIHLWFEEDKEEWWDTEHSSYPTVDPTDNTVRFREIRDLHIGDVIYLIKLSSFEDRKVEYVKRTIRDISKERKLIQGYTIALDGSHLFIAKSPESTAGYFSIEHNADTYCTCTRSGGTCSCRCSGSTPKCVGLSSCFVLDDNCYDK